MAEIQNELGNFGSVLNLQEVTNEGNETTNPLIVFNNDGFYEQKSYIGSSFIEVSDKDIALNETTRVTLENSGIRRYNIVDGSYMLDLTDASNAVPSTETRLLKAPILTADATIATTSDIGTWGALDYPAWTAGMPFVKMTAVGTFALDTNTYLTSADLSGYVPYVGATQNIRLGEFGLETSWDYGYANFGITNGDPNQRIISFYNSGDDISAPSTQDVQFDVAIDRGLVITHNELAQPNNIQMSVGNGEFVVQTQLEDNSTSISAANNKIQLVAADGTNDNTFDVQPTQTYSKRLFVSDTGFERPDGSLGQFYVKQEGAQYLGLRFDSYGDLEGTPNTTFLSNSEDGVYMTNNDNIDKYSSFNLNINNINHIVASGLTSSTTQFLFDRTNFNQSIEVPKVYLYDAANDAYAKINYFDGQYNFEDINGRVIKVIEKDGLEQTLNRYDFTLTKEISSLTADRTRTEPNKDGTYAMLDDIPTNTSQLVNDGEDGTSPFVTADQLPSNLNLFATNVSSDIATYFKLVTSIDDPDYNTTPVNIPTGAITTTGQFIAALATTANVLVGNPGIINLLTIGNVRRVSGSGTAEFYYEVYHRTSGGTETLISTSSKTPPISTNVYTEFLAAALLNNGTFLTTDRIVVKYYADRIGSGSNPSYEFQFGGTSPVRTNFPVPATNIPLDATPTDGSTNGVQSNGVFDALATKQNALTNPITGTGANGQVAFFNGVTTQTGDNGLFWDNTNKRLGVGTIGPSFALDVNGGARVQTNLTIGLTTNNGGSRTVFNGSTAGRSFQIANNWNAGNSFEITPSTTISGSVFTTPAFLINGTTSNIGIGTTTPTGRLSVTDTTIASGSANSGSLLDLSQTWNTTGTPTAIRLNVTNTASNANSLLMDLQVGGSSQFQVTRGGTAGTINTTNFTGRTLFLQGGSSTSTNIIESNNGYSGTSGVFNIFSYSAGFSPTSGGALLRVMNIAPVINQTGGANGITRGLFVNPTLTSAADFRAIETTNGTVIFTDTYEAVGGSNAGSLLDLSQTWNTTGTPTLIKANVTNIASIANSLLMDLQVGGVSQFNVTRLGTVSSARSFDAPAINVSTINGYINTSGTVNFLRIAGNILPSSGNAGFNTQIINPTINQTGGANGITRGLFVDPTLTSAFDFRAIENTVGNVTLNTTSGNTLIGTTTNNGSKLQVNGNITSTTYNGYVPLPTAAAATTGVTILFATDAIYGSIATPETGNITADVTGAQLGVTNIIIHNSGTVPTFSSEYKKLSGSGNYVASVVNYIYCTFITSTEIIYSINQRT